MYRKTIREKLKDILMPNRFIAWNTVEKIRRSHLAKLIGDDGEKVLDIGCRTPYLKNKIEAKGMKYFPVDIAPAKGVVKGDIENLQFKDNFFDITICSEVLEHVYDPIKAIKELKRVTKKRLIISVPYEPWFTFWRLMIWENGHLWAIRPKIFKKYFGRPSYEEIFFLKRYYIGIWDFKKS